MPTGRADPTPVILGSCVYTMLEFYVFFELPSVKNALIPRSPSLAREGQLSQSLN